MSSVYVVSSSPMGVRNTAGVARHTSGMLPPFTVRRVDDLRVKRPFPGSCMSLSLLLPGVWLRKGGTCAFVCAGWQSNS